MGRVGQQTNPADQGNVLLLLLQQLAGYDRALVGALVDLGIVGCSYQRPGHMFEIG
jgi:hypothetical protein